MIAKRNRYSVKEFKLMFICSHMPRCNMGTIVCSHMPRCNMRTIVRASCNFEGTAWVSYDMSYRRAAANKQSLDWGLPDQDGSMMPLSAVPG